MSVIDPVCGMEFDEEDAIVSLEYEGKVYHFCSRSCEQKFQADPATYVSKSEAA